MDRLTGMKVFLAVADAASFSAAGRALGVSKAMVSRHVAHLEDSLGVRLLQRSTRWVRLTEAGSAYQERCRRILADIDETERVVAALHAEPRGLLRVAAPTSLGSYHLAPAISDYTTLFPEVQVRRAFGSAGAPIQSGPVHSRRAEAAGVGEEAPKARRQLVPCT